MLRINLISCCSFVFLLIHTSMCERIELDYGNQICSHPSKDLFTLPFSNFRFSPKNVNESFHFLSEFSIQNGGIVKCNKDLKSSNLKFAHFELNAFDAVHGQSVSISLDVINDDRISFQYPKYEVIVDNVAECKKGETVKNLGNIKYNLPDLSPEIEYRLLPDVAQFRPVVAGENAFAIKYATDYCREGSYNFNLTIDAKKPDGTGNRASTEIEIIVGNQPSRKRRSASGQEDSRNIIKQIQENQIFGNLNVRSELGFDSESTFTYVILEFDDVFELDIATGVISQIPGTILDREEQESHEIKFNMRNVSDINRRLYFVAFSLTIIDEDDSAPQIVNELQPLQGFVPENPETGYRILELRINDPDITPDLDQREWTISLTTGNVNSLFELSATTIRPASEEESVWIQYAGDASQSLSNSFYSLTVRLSDQGPSEAVEYEVTITVGDPQLQVLPIPDVIYISEEEPSDTLVYRVRVEATDTSTPSYSFTQQGGNQNEFTFNSVFGEIYTNKRFDLDVTPGIQSEFSIEVRVTDSSLPNEQFVTRNFRIQVQDINDNSPIFSPKVYSATISEDRSPSDAIVFNNGEVTAVRAEDADITSPNNEIYYVIEDVVPFVVNQVTGEVFASGVDYEQTVGGVLNPFTIAARDKGTGGEVNEDVATVIITVLNVNDEAPIFSAEQQDGSCLYEFTVSQTISENFQIGSVSAYDPDGNSITYKIVANPSPPFAFQDEKRGILVRNGDTNSEGEFELTNEVYVFEVSAEENEQPSAGATNAKTCSVRVTVESANLNSPEFENCPNGLVIFEVLENSLVDTTVGTLRASDADFGQSGRIDFSAQQTSGTQWFRVDREVTSVNPEVAVGVVKVNSDGLDREQKDEHCFFALARDGYSDNGGLSSQYKQSACKVCVTLDDIPDTAPEFFSGSPVNVEVSTSETTPFFTVVAFDLDLVETSITYSIAEQSENKDNFELDSSNGELTGKNLNDLLNNGVSEFTTNLFILATDESGTQSQLQVIVNVVSEIGSGTPPVFLDTKNGQYIYDVPENYTVGTPLVPSINVQLDTTGTGTSICLFGQGFPNEETEQLFGYSSSSTTMRIQLKRSLDFDAGNKRHTFEVRCQDSSRSYLESSVVVIVNVLDVNDLIPFFSDQSNEFSIYEDATIGDFVGQVSADDEDTDTNLTYSLVASEGFEASWFVISSVSGEITVGSALLQGQWIATAKVNDGVTSANNDLGLPNESERQVIVYILDVNDEAPIVVPQDGNEAQPFEVSEAANVNFVIAGFDAQDNDTDPAQSFTFSITQDSGYVPFTIDNQGLLKVSDNLDVDDDAAVDTYTFEIQVFDNVQNSDPFPVTVNVLNADDEAPVFLSSNTFSITEENDSRVGQIVFTVEAENDDVVDGTEPGVTYSLSGDSVGDVFEINPDTGDIALLRVVDREAVSGSEFFLLATATEIASGLNNVMELIVTIIDINDHAPYFDESQLRGSIDENSPDDDIVMTVFAQDEDLSEPPLNYGTIVNYTMIGGTCGGLFAVRSNGDIIVASQDQLDREQLGFEFDECTVDIEAEDGGGLKGDTTITIVIDDVDDNVPFFQPSEVFDNIEERTEPQTIVYGLAVFDADTVAVNSEMNDVRLVTNNPNFPDDESFKVEYEPVRGSVIIRNDVPLLFAELNLVPGDELKIEMELLQNGVVVDTAECTFTLIDWNNHAPELAIVNPPSPSDLPIELTEGDGFDSGIPIAVVQATDQDDEEQGVSNNDPNGRNRRSTGDRKKFSWYIFWGSDPRIRFRVEQDPGDGSKANVYQIEPLDHEIATEQQFSLQVCAEDNPQESYKPILSDCIDIPIETLNIDNKCPVFQPHPVMTVVEGTSDPEVWDATFIDFDQENSADTNGNPSIRKVWSLDEDVFEFNEVFQLIKKEGVILDRETKEFYQAVFEVCDDEDNCCNHTVYIRVSDINDNSQSDGGVSLVDVFYLDVDDIHETAVQADLSDPVQVTDADCCTSSGKTFLMTSTSSDTTSRFLVGDNNGALTIFRGLTQGDFVVDVRVTETNPGVSTVSSQFRIKAMPVNENLIDHMMTIKIIGITADQFVGKATHFSRVNYHARLRDNIKDVMSLESSEQVVIFGLKESDDEFETDYGWPYHQPELDIGLAVRTAPGADSFFSPVLTNYYLASNRVKLSGDLGLTVAEVNVELCDTEVTGAQDTCYTKRTLDPTGAIVVGSSSPYSIVALRLNIEAVTDELYYRAIAPQRLFNIRDEVCVKNPCKNGGECFSEYGDLSTQTMRYTYRCECVPGFMGPNCEQTQRTFTGSSSAPSFALFEPLVFYSANEHLSFNFMTDQPTGLLMYAGPMDTLYQATIVESLNQNKDFVAIELVDGTLRLHANTGCGTLILDLPSNSSRVLHDGLLHHVDMFMEEHYVTLRLDMCIGADVDESDHGPFYSRVTRRGLCQVSGHIPGCGNFITTPQPLQLGGMATDKLPYQNLSSDYFNGVISEVVSNGYVLDLAEPRILENSIIGDIKTDSFCFDEDTAVCAGNSKCVASLTQFFFCDCEPTRYGDRCQYTNEPHYFDSELASFILYDVSASSLLGRESMLTSVPIEMTNERQVIMQVTFRTRASDALLMVIEHKLKYEFIQLDLFGGIPRVRINLGNKLDTFELTSNGLTDAEAGVWAADGNEHTLALNRVNNYLVLSLDGGNAYRTIAVQWSAHSLLRFDNMSVSLGGSPSYNSQTGLYIVSNAFKGCISDARLNGFALPIMIREPDALDSDVTTADGVTVIVSQGLERGCEKDACGQRALNGQDCPAPRVLCLNWFDGFFCVCPTGSSYLIDTDTCQDINECGEPGNPTGVCLNNGDCVNYDPLNETANPNQFQFVCICARGFVGPLCQFPEDLDASARLSVEAALVIILALLLLIPLLCLFMACLLRQRKRKVKGAGTYDDQKLGYSQYEGGGERDQDFYNIFPLRKPKSDIFYTSEGPVAIDDPVAMYNMQNPPIFEQNPMYLMNGGGPQVNSGFVPDESDQTPPPRRAAANYPPEQTIGDILDPRLQDADEALNRRGADCLMVYHYEGEGSETGTLSTVNTSPQTQPDWNQFYSWQTDPQLGLIAQMFTDGASEQD